MSLPRWPQVRFIVPRVSAAGRTKAPPRSTLAPPAPRLPPPSPPWHALVKECQRNARGLARRYCARSSMPYEEAESVATLGLVQAARAWRPSNPQTGLGAFVVFATIRIQGALVDASRDWDLLGRDTRRDLNKAKDVARALGPSADREEVAAAAGMTVGKLDELFQAELASHHVHDEWLEDRAPADMASPEDQAADRQAARRLRQLIEQLGGKRRHVMLEHGLGGRTLKAVGAEVQVSESRACQIYTEGLAQLKEVA